MRRDGHDRINQQRYEKTLTMGDLCQAIAQRRIPAQRDGDDYIMRVADVRAVWERLLRDDLERDELEIAPDNDTSSLEMGRLA